MKTTDDCTQPAQDGQFRRWLGVNEDCMSAAMVILAFGIAISLAASAIGWPVAYYNAEVTKATIQGGYEWSTDQRGHTVLQKAKEK